MASADRITVFVKSLAGEILSLEVDPSLGLNGVADTLSSADPDAFPIGLTDVSFMDDEQKEITHETMLMVLVQEPEPLESIVRVDTFDWNGGTAYRFRIKADRTKSMTWMPDKYRGHNVRSKFQHFPQLFDVCYYPADKTFMIPYGGSTLDRLKVDVGTHDTSVATLLKKHIIYRRDNVGFHEFHDPISRLPTLEERIDWSRFLLNDDAILRISERITNFIYELPF